MSETADRTTGGVQSVERALDLLDLLAASPQSLSITELSRRTGLPYATTHRLIATLTKRGYLRQDQPGKGHELGPQVVFAGSQLALRLGNWLRPHLTQLMEFSGETVNVAVLDNGYINYVAQAEPKNQLRMFTEVGSRVLPHATAVGKILLAGEPRDKVEASLLRLGMPARTKNTITDLGLFLRELEEVSVQGYAVDAEEGEIGMRCVAVALRVGGMVMGLSVSGPAGRMDSAAQSRLVPEMHRIAEEISVSLVPSAHFVAETA